MGITSSKNNSESLNWDKINTESMSSTVPNLNNISKDAEQLISNLDIANQINLEETESDNDNLFTWIKTIGDEKTEQKQKVQEDDFSDTSPFISSDMYKYLMDNKDENTSATSNAQVGGGIKEDSSTSSTSSSPRKNKKFTESSSELSGGNLSYISSSAHTEKSETKIESTSDDNYSSSPDSENETSVSVHNNKMLTSSVNTSDINLVSPDTN